MRLCIDIGNTRIKWGWSPEPGVVLHPGASARWDAVFLQMPAARPQEILVADVRGGNVAGQLRRVLAEREWPAPTFLSSCAEFSGLRIAYHKPETLGVDRFLALLGALPLRPCVIASAGTALTLDAVDANGVHLGGVILPGLRAGLAGLCHAAPALRGQADLARATLEPWGGSTAEALNNGALYAWVGGADRVIHDMLDALGTDCQVVVTGGDGPLLRRWLQSHAQYDELLVLRGMTHF